MCKPSQSLNAYKKSPGYIYSLRKLFTGLVTPALMDS